ncbi:unnamed protein product [Absidia cylindrospora]
MREENPVLDTSLHLHNLKHVLQTISQQENRPKYARQKATEILDKWKVNVRTSRPSSPTPPPPPPPFVMFKPSITTLTTM